MKKLSIIYIVAGLLIFSTSGVSAQAFYNFQSIQKHTVFFSLTWQKKIVLGAGYAYRAGGDIQFADISIEWKAPVDQYFDGKNFEAITGAFVRHSSGRGGLGTGYHLSIKKSTDDQKIATMADLAISLLPGTIFAAPLDDAMGGSFAGRLTYSPTLYASVKDKSGEGTTTNKAFAAHTFKAGLHLDLIFKRALGLAVNPVMVKTFTSDTFRLADTPDWDFQSDLYFGPTWLLSRSD